MIGRHGAIEHKTKRNPSGRNMFALTWENLHNNAATAPLSFDSSYFKGLVCCCWLFSIEACDTCLFDINLHSTHFR